jgi:N-acetylneuraminic acid mutarotase
MVVLRDGSLVLMGGGVTNTDDGFTNDVWGSADRGRTWTRLSGHAGWTGRGDHSSVVLQDGTIVLTGGYNRTDRGAMGDVWSSADGGTTWVLVNASPGWTPRAFHSTVVLADGSMVLMGGSDENGNRNDVWRSADGGKTWIQLPDAGWSARAGQSCVVMPDGSIILTGGMDNSMIRNDVWRSADGGRSWTQLPDAGWVPRGFHTSVVLPDGSIVLMGGEDLNYMKDVWRSPDGGRSWTRLPDAAWSGRGGAAGVAMPDGSIVLTGGFDSRGITGDVWRLSTRGAVINGQVTGSTYGSGTGTQGRVPGIPGGTPALLLAGILVAGLAGFAVWHRRRHTGKK